jgi:hypothetical protein
MTAPTPQAIRAECLKIALERHPGPEEDGQMLALAERMADFVLGGTREIVHVEVPRPLDIERVVQEIDAPPAQAAEEAGESPGANGPDLPAEALDFIRVIADAGGTAIVDADALASAIECDPASIPWLVRRLQEDHGVGAERDAAGRWVFTLPGPGPQSESKTPLSSRATA